MKSIIDDKLYDTETSKELFKLKSETKNSYLSKAAFYETTYYQKKTGEFFYVNKTIVPDSIGATTKEQICKLAENNLTADQYQVAFGQRME